MVSETKTIRVLIVDDHDMLRSGVSVVLSEFPDLEVVGAASSGAEAVEQCKLLQPDVVLLDILLPDFDGLTAARMIRRTMPHVRFVILSSFEDDQLLEAAHEIGIAGYLLKNVSIDELADALRSAYAGNAGQYPR